VNRGDTAGPVAGNAWALVGVPDAPGPALGSERHRVTGADGRLNVAFGIRDGHGERGCGSTAETGDGR